MNIFKEYRGFTGSFDFVEPSNFSCGSIFKLAADIKRQLGTKEYLMDKYLSLVFKGLDAFLTANLVEMGCEAETELYNLIQSVLERDEIKEKHPFYQTVVECVEQTLLVFQDQDTAVQFYTIQLEDRFLEYKLKDIFVELKDIISRSLDIVQVDNTYREICSHLYSESMMEELNFILMRRFLLAYPIQIILQSMTSEFINSLIYVDDESGKQLFRLL